WEWPPLVHRTALRAARTDRSQTRVAGEALRGTAGGAELRGSAGRRAGEDTLARPKDLNDSSLRLGWSHGRHRVAARGGTARDRAPARGALHRRPTPPRDRGHRARGGARGAPLGLGAGRLRRAAR